MMEYYKQMHTSYIDEIKASEGGSKAFNKNLGSTSKKQMDDLMKPFIEDQLDLQDTPLLKDNRQFSDVDKQFLNSMTLIVFAHRNKKEDQFLKEM